MRPSPAIRPRPAQLDGRRAVSVRGSRPVTADHLRLDRSRGRHRIREAAALYVKEPERLHGWLGDLLCDALEQIGKGSLEQLRLDRGRAKEITEVAAPCYAPRRSARVGVQRGPFRRTWASTSAPSLMLRTASAKPFPAASPEDGAVIAAGMSTTVAFSRKSGMPRSRARTEA
jgi:hypothetical protein